MRASLNFLRPSHYSDSSGSDDDDSSVSSEHDSMSGADYEEFVTVEQLNEKKKEKHEAEIMRKINQGI